MMERIAGLWGRRIHITGIVQGVGFRPFVYTQATKYSLKGWIKNTSSGVDLEIDGDPEGIQSFLEALHTQAPPLARIEHIEVEEIAPNHFPDFRIRHSTSNENGFQPISADVSLCEDCLRELHDPGDRRYRYPFINCTNCGPRFTIIRDLPYDRPKTTMTSFQMCPQCTLEYEDPLDRRFHAQPIACPDCGPHIWLEIGGKTVATCDEALLRLRELIADGGIVAIKGLGGFHIACDARRGNVVSELRRRKGRIDKPFALMLADVESVERHCAVDTGEREMLQSRERPIVVLERRPRSEISEEVAPGTHSLGVMLPYTPLHSLLLQAAPDFPDALIMTSGNRTDEPILIENTEARRHLEGIVDAFLMHDRDIGIRADDTVTRVFQGRNYPIRRSRGFTPNPIRLDRSSVQVLAVGAELKNSFCITRENYAFLSQHIGNLWSIETLAAFEMGVKHFERLYRLRPEVLAHDLHPDYLSTRYARERGRAEGIPTLAIQHHHAHLAACLADSGYARDEPVIGVVFDGAGYGEDGASWGGEFLLADCTSYRRCAHLTYSPLPGGDRAVLEPWRLALSWLRKCDESEQAQTWLKGIPPSQIEVVTHQIERNINCPSTSSMGRLFDGVASLLGVRNQVHYEGQAAIELEAIVDPDENGLYMFGGSMEIDPVPLINAILADLQRHVPPTTIAARFHNAVAHMVLERCQALRRETGIGVVVLSGGVWQNMILLDRTHHNLLNDGFEVLCHHQVPANDGGLALGQAVITQARLAG